MGPEHTVLSKGVASLAFASKAVTEQVKAVDKARIVKRLGTLPAPQLAQVEQALKNTLGLW